MNCGTLQVRAKRLAPLVVQALLARHRDDARAAWFHLGAVLLDQNRRDEARSALDKARYEPGTTPTDAEIGVLRAWTLDEESAEPSVVLQAYLDAALLDPVLAGDILPAAQALLFTDEAKVLGPWIRSSWLPAMRAAAGVDTHALALFHTRVAVFMGDGPEASTALADALRAGRGPDHVAVADELAGLPDAPLPEAEWRLLIGLALERLDEPVAALRFVCEAQERQLPDTGPFGDAEARVAEADLLDDILTTGSAEADTRRYEAANMFAARGEHDRAIEMFELSAARWGYNPELHWSWADSIRLATHQSRELAPADAHEQIMARWRVGTGIALPEESSSWSYLVPAFAVENLSWRDPKRPRELLWQACLWAERTLRLDQSSMPAYLLLARCHRQLENYAVAMVSVEAALDAQPDGSTDATDEHAMLLSFLSPEQAQAALTGTAEIAGDEDRRARWELALAAGQSANADAAFEHLAMLTPDAADPWQVWAYGWVLRLFDRDEEAAVWFAQLRESPTGDRSRTWFRAYAAYALGDLDAAAAEIKEFLVTVDESSHRRHDFLVLLGLVRLVQGRIERGEQPLREAARLIRTRRDALDAVADLRALARRTDDMAVAKSAGTLIELFEQRASEVAEPALDVDAARAELAQMLEQTTGSARFACQATLARLSCTDEHVADAMAGYARLLEHRDLFPEAARGLLEAGVLDIDRTIADSDPATAVNRIDALRGPLTAAADTRVAWAAYLNVREAIARFWLGEAEIGCARFADAVAEVRPLSASAGFDIGNIWRELVPSPEAYWRIADQLTNSCDEDLRIAADRLDHYLDDVLGCTQEDPGDPEFVPCGLTIGSALVPTDRGPGSHLFTELLPAVYQDLESAYGVIVPQVTVTEDPFIGPNEYQIELWGAQIRADEVSPDGPEALTTVTQRFAEELREHLPVLGCIDMTEKLLTRWTADWPELVSQAIGDDIGLVTLNMVLCMLLDRGRSIADGRAVLETFADLGSGEAVTIDELADRCARRLAPAPVPELRS